MVEQHGRQEGQQLRCAGSNPATHIRGTSKSISHARTRLIPRAVAAVCVASKGEGYRNGPSNDGWPLQAKAVHA
eukprot:2203420-Alexandrium_andersonii.AAC.1